jgi:hypothetical protein
VFFWYIGTAVFAVGLVFRDSRFDYRWLMVGAVLPLADVFGGSERPLHSVVVTIGVLAVIMLATIGHRSLRRSLLGLPIGMFLHLVFGGAWTNTDVFWWPLTGWRVGRTGSPLTAAGGASVVLEAIGIALCVWIVRVNGLADRPRRTEFLHSGRLMVPLVG